ncbi:VOC family protein [Streptomyces sp. 2112.3]|uniref:VOC family protein n=1 Tax=Streptomyces sp. 2112.3 TaxID=1881023 RepID=UPI000AC7B3CD
MARLRKADDKRLDLVSYGAAHPADVDTLAERLLAGGVQLITHPGTVDTPGGGYGFRFFDIDGRTIEVSADLQARRHRKIEERESIPVKLSHVVLNSNDIHRTRTWYEKHLGFRLSDTLSSPHMGEVMHFMRISNQHHSMCHRQGPPHLTAPPLLRDARHRRVHARLRPGTPCRIHQGVGPRPPHGRRQHLHVLPRPARQHRRIHDGAGVLGRGHLAPARLRLLPARGHRPVGHRQRDERDRRHGVVQRPRPRRLRRPAV